MRSSPATPAVRLRTMGDGERSGALGVLYGAVLTVVVLGGVFAIVDWARRGNDLPGGAVPVTGRVVQEEPGFAGARAIVEVSYEAGRKERRARLSVQDGDGDPNEPRYRPGDAISLKVSRTAGSRPARELGLRRRLDVDPRLVCGAGRRRPDRPAARSRCPSAPRGSDRFVPGVVTRATAARFGGGLDPQRLQDWRRERDLNPR
jgi:hypothetical protein